MDSIFINLAKAIAPALIQTLRTLAQKTENKIDDHLVDTVEFILKKMKVIN